jgi:hypothetical protein
MKNYLLTIFSPEDNEKRWAAMTPEQMQAAHKAYMDYNQRLVDEGRRVAGEGLSMRGAFFKADNGGVQVTDGPYVFAKELVGGVWLSAVEANV